MWSIGLIVFSAFLTHAAIGQYARECLLPNQQTGRCMPLASCKPIYEFFRKVEAEHRSISKEESQSLFRQHCGTFNKVVHVCCKESDIQLNPQGLEILKKQVSCGIYTTPKVSHGHEAALSGYPWMALLIYDNERDPYRCAGALISERYVLTAAHCIEDNLYLVRLGEHRISTERDCIANSTVCAPPVEDVGIEEIIPYPDYVRFSHDIALIRLNRTILYETKSHIKPACLPIYDELRRRSFPEYIIAGWGRTDKATSSDVLMVALVPIVERPECQSILKQYRLRRPLTYGHICAGNRNLTDSCDGDSGGPLGYKDSYDGRPRFVQFGVVSFGINLCGEGNAPNAYTNVSHYIQWITDTMKP